MSRIKNAINQDKMFINNAIVKVPRSIFNMNQKHSTTFNAGRLIPLCAPIEVIPGDSMEIKLDSVIRTTSPFIKAPMDDLRMDMYAFFVPSRIVYSKFPNMIANYHENPDWTIDTDIVVPRLGWTTEVGLTKEDRMNTIADYFGIPPMSDGWLGSEKEEAFGINALPIRAYCAIWNEWFRDENLQNTIFIDKDNYTFATLGGNHENYMISAINGGQTLPLNKIKDYFTSALPAPQAGAAAALSLGGTAPVEGSVSFNDANVIGGALEKYHDMGNAVMFGVKPDSSTVYSYYHNMGLYFNSSGGGSPHGWLEIDKTQGTMPTEVEPAMGSNLYVPSSELKVSESNLYADLSHVSGISVNDLRYLIQIQQIKELDARYGRRYKEYLMGHWGVLSADARLQIPEFLGHTGYDLNVNQTVQTSGTLISDESNTTATTPQSNISSYSLTSGSGKICNKSFTEHGYIIIVGGVRIKKHTYTQGINRMWFRQSRFDFYDPCLANIGEQPVYNAEIYLDANSVNDVFGYQEAWASYRYTPNYCSGYQRPSVEQTLAYWNFADNYTEQPTLSSGWIEEDISSIDRCLAIPSSTVPQFTADFYVRNKATRPMPVHSIPGLLDHSGKIII